MPAINHVCGTGSRAWRAPTAVIPGLLYFRVGAGHARDQSDLQHRVARMARSYSVERCALIQRYCDLPRQSKRKTGRAKSVFERVGAGERIAARLHGRDRRERSRPCR